MSYYFQVMVQKYQVSTIYHKTTTNYITQITTWIYYDHADFTFSAFPKNELADISAYLEFQLQTPDVLLGKFSYMPLW